MGGVYIAPFPDPSHYGWGIEEATDFALKELDYLLQTLEPPAETAAFFVEPVLGEGGYVPANERFFAGLRERADRHGILLVLDEMQTGLGPDRQSSGAVTTSSIEADIIITAKGHCIRLPDLRHRCPRRHHGQGMAGIARRHLRRERGRVRSRPCDPGRRSRRRTSSRTRSPGRGAQLKQALQSGGRQARADHRRARPRADARQRVPGRRRQTRRCNGGCRPAGSRTPRTAPAHVRSLESGGAVHPCPRRAADHVDEAAGLWADAVGAVVT